MGRERGSYRSFGLVFLRCNPRDLLPLLPRTAARNGDLETPNSPFVGTSLSLLSDPCFSHSCCGCLLSLLKCILLGGAVYAIGVDFPIEVDPSRVLRRISCPASSLSISGPGCCTILDFGSEQCFFHIQTCRWRDLCLCIPVLC